MNTTNEYPSAKKIGFLYIVPMLLACLFLQGCTVTLWKDALSKNIYFYRIEGVAFRQTENSNVSKYLIVTYGYKSDYQPTMNPILYYGIPVVNEKVPQLFDYHGVKQSVKEIISDLPKEQLYRIQNYRFSEEEHKLGETLITSKDFLRSNTWTNGPASYSPEMVVVSEKNIRIVKDGIIFIPYCWGNNVIPPRKLKLYEDPYDEPFDPHCKILMLPGEQVCPDAERKKKIVSAIKCTPLTLAADALMSPAYCIFAIITFSDPNFYGRPHV